MTLVMAMELPVLNFCACQKVLFVSDCACESSHCASDCSDDCQQTSAAASPCETQGDTERCSIALEYDLGDFSPLMPNDKIVSIEHSDFDNPSFVESLCFSSHEAQSLAHPTRGSPHLLAPPTVALHKRHSVFLI